METNGYPRRLGFTSCDDIIKHKSASLPNYASSSVVVNPFATFTHPSSVDRTFQPNANVQKDARKISADKSKKHFRWFRKVQNQIVGRSDSDSTSSISSSPSENVVPTRDPSAGGGGGGGSSSTLNFTSLCVRKSKHYGDGTSDNMCGEKSLQSNKELRQTVHVSKGNNVYRENTNGRSVVGSSRLSQSSKDLREVRPVKDLFGGFSLFTSCKRSPSLRDSLDSLNRRGKRDALKARVEAQRQQYRDTSSDDEEQWQQVKKYYSDEALHKASKEKRLREARTERFYKRKNHRDDESTTKSENRKAVYDDGHQSYSRHNFQKTLDPVTNTPKTHSKSGQLNELGNGIVSGGGGGNKPPNKNGKYRDLPAGTDTIFSCQLPIKKLGTMDGGVTVGRAPTPPPRSFTKFHMLPCTATGDGGGGPYWHLGRRPQSYAFETLLSPTRLNNGSSAQQQPTSENEARKIFQQMNGAFRVKTPPVVATASYSSSSSSKVSSNHPMQRPLSFTTTSQVIYNYPHFGKGGEDAIKEPGPANAQVDMWQHQLPPEAQINYMSDSQLSEKNPAHRRASVQLSDVSEASKGKQSLHNFNSLAKPWSPGLAPPPASCAFPAELSNSSLNYAGHPLMISRPPPSPVRQSQTDVFVFPSPGCRGGGGTSGNSDLPSPKQQLTTAVVTPTSTTSTTTTTAVSASIDHQAFSGNSVKDNQFKNNNKTAATRPLSLVLESLESTSGRESRRSNRIRGSSSGGGGGAGGSSPPPPPTRKHFRHTRSSNLEAIGQHLDKSVAANIKGNKGNDNLEDALLELEKIYQSMKNDDEAFYAEERLLSGGRRNSVCVEGVGSKSTAGRGLLTKTPTMGSCDSLLDQLERVCSVNSRKSDRSSDDLAYRKLSRATDCASRPSSAYMGTTTTTGSYLMLSPALSPSISIEDVMIQQSSEPHTVLDDLAFRNIRDANLQKVVDPQPPFGIPLGPVVRASPNDYLHAQVQDLSRPKLIRRFRPDVVKDDLAYRNLRRDKRENNNNATANNSPPVRPQSAFVQSGLNFDDLDNIVDVDLQQAINSRKKYRAARSLSANLSHLICKNDGRNAGEFLLTIPKSSQQGLDTATEKSQSLNDLTDILGARRPENPKVVRQEQIYNSQSDVDHDHRRPAQEFQPRCGVQLGKHSTSPSSSSASALRSQKCNGRHQQDADSSSSTDTLTETPDKVPRTSSSGHPLVDDHPKGNTTTTTDSNEIWQVRVTLGAVNTTGSRRNSQELETPVVANSGDVFPKGSSSGHLSSSNSKKTRDKMSSTPDIVVPPRSSSSRDNVMALRRNYIQFGYVSDSDAQLTRPKGSPIDERQLDDLLNSLAQGAAEAPSTLQSSVHPSVVVHQRSVSCPQSPEDCYQRPPSFLSVPTSVVMDSQTGEVSAKLVLPRLKFAGEGDRSANKEGSATRCLKLSPSAYYGVNSSRIRDREMMPAFGRTRNMVATTTTTSCSTDKSSLDKIMPSSISGYANFGTGAKMESCVVAAAAASTAKESVGVVAKDSCSKVTERPPTLRKLMSGSGSGGGTTVAMEESSNSNTGGGGGGGVKLSDEQQQEKLSERMARYKEERRKQLATQYGQWSSSEDAAPTVGDEPSYMRYSRRYKKKVATTPEVQDGCDGRDGNGNDNSNDHQLKFVTTTTTAVVRGVGQSAEDGSDACNNRQQSTTPGSPSSKALDRTFSPVDAVVRSNRASRLRAKMNGTCTSEGIGSITECTWQGSFRSKVPANLRLETSAMTMNVSQGATPISSSSEAHFSQGGGAEPALHITTESESGGTGSDAQGRPKDKSAKRKSNLNRMGALESPPVPSDSAGYDTPRRSRKSRHLPGETPATGGVSSASADGAQSDCLKSVGIVQSIQQQLSSASQNRALDLKAPATQNGSPLRRSGSWRLKDQDVDTSDSDFERGGSFRRYRRSALKRPEIPDIFRQKTVSATRLVDSGGDHQRDVVSKPPFRTTSGSSSTTATAITSDVHAPSSPLVSTTCGGGTSANGVDRNTSKFGQQQPHHRKEDGPWWEVIKRPPKAPFSDLNSSQRHHDSDDYQTHSLKVNVGSSLNGKSTDGNVSDTLRELTELVRETTCRVDCLTDAARRVELRSPSNLNEIMGGRLAKSSYSTTNTPSTQDDRASSSSQPSTRVNNGDKSSPGLVVQQESEDVDKRTSGSSSRYTADGNWQLSRSPPTNGVFQRTREDHAGKTSNGHSVTDDGTGTSRNLAPGDSPASGSRQSLSSSGSAADYHQAVGSPNLPSALKRFGSFSSLTASQGIVVPECQNPGIVSRAELGLEQELLSIINALDGNSFLSTPRRRSLCVDGRGEVVPSDVHQNVGGQPLGSEAADGHGTTPSILKRKSVVDDAEIHTKSILKHKDDKTTEGKPPVPPSILKRGSFDDVSRHHSPEKTSSILKKRGSSEDSDHRSSSPEVVSILRRRSAEETEAGGGGDHVFGERHSILRRKSATEEAEHGRSILKKQSTVEGTDGSHAEPRPILKKKTSVEETELVDPKPILKKRSSVEEDLEERPKPILKVRKRSGQEDIVEDPVRGTSSSTNVRMRYLEDEVLTSAPLAATVRLSSTSSTARHSTVSSEDEYHSLPSSPVNWKMRKDSDVEVEDVGTKSLRICSRSQAAVATPTGNRDTAITTAAIVGIKGGEKIAVDKVQGVEKSSPFLDPTLETIAQTLRVSKEDGEDDDDDNKDDGSGNSSSSSSSSEEEEESTTTTTSSSSSSDKGKCLGVSSSGKTLSTTTASPAVTTTASPTVTTTAIPATKFRDLSEDDGGSASRPSSATVSSSRETSSRLAATVAASRSGEAERQNSSVRKDVSRSKEVEQPVEAVNTKVVTRVDKQLSDDEQDKTNDSTGEEDVIHLSVAAKASLFMQKLEEQRSPRPAVVRKFVNRRNLQRSQTQPITVEEVQEAAKIAEDSARRQKNIDESEQKTATSSSSDRSITGGQDGGEMASQSRETPESEDDPSKLSLAERVKLFNQKMIEVRLPTRKLSNGGEPTTPSSEHPLRRRRVVSTRFRTQPVTTEEVEKAQRISPLATSLTKACEEVVVPDVAPTRAYRSNIMLKVKEEKEASSLKSSTTSSVTMTTTSSTAAVAQAVFTGGSDSANRPKGILKKREDMLQLSKLECSQSSNSNVSGTVTTTSTTKTSTSEFNSCRQQTTAVSKYSSGYSKVTSTSSSSSSHSPGSELKSILKDTPRPTSPVRRTLLVDKAEEEHSSSSSTSSTSSSSDDDEEETEGITINLRDSSGSHSSPSTASDTPRIRNEAVLRRRNATLRKLEEKKIATELQHSQSLTLESSFACKSEAVSTALMSHLATAAAATAAKRDVRTTTTSATQRSSTQPLTRMEQMAAANGAVASEVKSSIAQRLAALQASQQEDWKRRLAKMKADEPEEDTRMSYSESESMSVTGGDESPSKIMEKVSLLEVSQQGWRSRVEEKDVSKFTVAGKMGKVSPPTESPLLDRKKRTPKPVRFQSRTANLLELAKGISPSIPATPPNLPIARSKSMPMSQAAKDEEKMVKVTVPKPDEEGLSSFFQSVSLDKLQSQKVEVAESAFNAITSESRQLLVQKRTVQVVRHHAGAKNPLKSLAARQDLLQEEYTEVRTGVAERELKRMKVEQLAKHSDLATSALAGLASTEDFKNVSLRKSSSVMNFQLLPYKDLMLIQVKGRRHVQCRLVEPKLTSLNQGDCFILVTPNEVYHWIGEFSNVIERVKGSEVAAIIQGKKDLGCKNAEDVITIDEEKKTSSRSQQRDFYQHLGGQDDVAEAGSPEEDEIFEASVTDTNKVYNVEGNELVPYDKYWGGLLRVEMLEQTKVLVFDFGSEMYVWQGKLATNELRKRAIQLAQELWSEGYDYTDCDANPLNPCRSKVVLSFAKQRPLWALFAKVNQHMETVLFRSKFVDWPDMERVIRVKRQDSEAKSDGSIDLQPCDVNEMLSSKAGEPDMVLENCHLGRGLFYWDEDERRHCDISTLGIKVWHILEFNHSILPIESWGQFYSGETYVVRWQYRVTVVGRQLSGKLSKHSSLGRERCAYFFWQGSHSTISEKGASALMTVELDEERGPHVRVVQGYEPPCFLNLFKGSMVVHRGKTEEGKCPAKWRMFVVRAEFDHEAHLLEIACQTRSLRSGSAFVVVHRKKCLVYLWLGAHVPQHVKDVSRYAVESIKDRKPPEFGFEIGDAVEVKEQVQGSESDDFFKGLGGKPDDQCAGALKNYLPVVTTPRLFYMTSVSGVFVATEVTCKFGSTERTCAFPFLQTELYDKVQQPALFLLDRGAELYLWQGWWPESSDDNDNTSTGSAHIRWNVERRLAMETAIEYCNAKNAESPPVACAVWAGLEPIEFKHLFPEWEERDDVTELNLKDGGRQMGEKKSVKDTLVVLKRTRYPFAQLQERPLPEGVDPSILESYLISEEFMEVLKMSKKEFYALPSWKQVSLKKTAGLY